MAITATSDVIQGLRYTYGADRLQYIASQEVPLWNVLSKTKKDMGGRGQFLIPILTRNPGAWTGITQGGTLPTALSPATTEASYQLKEFVGIYELSWKLIQDARTSKFAFQQAIQMMDDGLRRRIFRLLNADLLGTGRGELGALAAASNTDPVTVRYLPRVEPGMPVDLIANTDDATTRGIANLTVTAVDAVGRTVKTGTAAAGTAANDYFTIASTMTASLQLHMNGLLGVINSVNPQVAWNAANTGTQVATIGGIDRSVAGNEFWKSPVLSNSGVARALTEDLWLQAEDQVREKVGAKLTNWFMNLAIGRRYHEIIRADTFFTAGRAEPLGGGIGRDGNGSQGAGADGDGKSPYEFSGVAVHFDPFFESNTIVGFDRSHFFLGVGDNETPAPISDIFDNIPFFRQTANASFQVAWYWQGQLITDSPPAGVQIKDIAES